jgi:hypothetical protein
MLWMGRIGKKDNMAKIRLTLCGKNTLEDIVFPKKLLKMLLRLAKIQLENDDGWFHYKGNATMEYDTETDEITYLF